MLDEQAARAAFAAADQADSFRPMTAWQVWRRAWEAAQAAPAQSDPIRGERRMQRRISRLQKQVADLRAANTGLHSKWICAEKALRAPAPAVAAPTAEQKPDGRLHADGYFTWARRDGYAMDRRLPCDFYLAAQPSATPKDPKP